MKISVLLFCASVLKTCSKFLTAVSTYFYIIICFIDNIYKKYIKKKHQLTHLMPTEVLDIFQ